MIINLVNVTINCPYVVSLVLDKNTNNKINILDFGGGYGSGHMILKKNINVKLLNKIKYYIIESSELISNFKNQNKEVIFISDFNKNINYNLIISSSCIQYIQDWKKLIEKFSKLKPKYIYLCDLFAGNIKKDFVSIQKYYDSRIPQWFFREDIFLKEFSNNGYELILKEVADIYRLDKRIKINMTNFPKQYQIKNTLNVLFKRK